MPHEDTNPPPKLPMVAIPCPPFLFSRGIRQISESKSQKTPNNISLITAVNGSVTIGSKVVTPLVKKDPIRIPAIDPGMNAITASFDGRRFSIVEVGADEIGSGCDDGGESGFDKVWPLELSIICSTVGRNRRTD